MAVGDIFKLVLRSQLHGQTILNTFHYRQSVATADPETDLTDAFLNEVLDPIQSVASFQVTYRAILVQKVFPFPLLVAKETTLGAATAGIKAGVSDATSIAVVISRVTAQAGRDRRGRVYYAGIPEADTTDSQVAPAALPDWETLADAMTDVISVGGGAFQPVLFRRSSGTTTFITRHIVRPILRNQRRRQVGRGI